MDLRQTLTAELGQRQRRNPRYSLRAFARDLGTDHVTLSQALIPKSVLPDGDAMAVLLDPTGISFAVCQTKPQP